MDQEATNIPVELPEAGRISRLNGWLIAPALRYIKGSGHLPKVDLNNQAVARNLIKRGCGSISFKA